MSFTQALRTVGWLTRDTFRQSLAYGIFWILLAVSIISTAVCATVRLDGDIALAQPGERPDFLPRNDPDARDRKRVEQSGVTVVEGDFSLGFGSIKLPLARDAREAVHFLQLVLAGGVADAMGLLLTLIWTAGFLPGFLDSRGAPVLLAKPAPRWLLLLGKYVGVLSFVLLHAVLFVGGTWLALGWRTGVWESAYLWCVPLLLAHFAIFFSFSLLLAVCTRSTVVCVFGSIVFWCICWGMNFGRHAALAETYHPTEATFAGPALSLVEAGYWTLPKPADIGMVLYDALEAGESFGQIAAFESVATHGDFHPWLSFAASLAFMAVVLFGAARQFAVLDY